jgi:hypothetical protein
MAMGRTCTRMPVSDVHACMLRKTHDHDQVCMPLHVCLHTCTYIYMYVRTGIEDRSRSRLAMGAPALAMAKEFDFVDCNRSRRLPSYIQAHVDKGEGSGEEIRTQGICISNAMANKLSCDRDGFVSG